MDDLPDAGGASAATLDSLARIYPAGAVLFEEGDPGSRMYVVRTGRVKIARRVAGADVTLAVLGPGEFFGEMAVLEKLPRTATATVLDDARLIEVDESSFELLVRRSEISSRLLRRLSARLREADRQLQALLASNGAARVLVLLRALALPADEAGLRVLPDTVSREELAVRAGMHARDAAKHFDRLLAAGVLVAAGPGYRLASEPILHEYALFLELQETYEPLTVEELAALSGLPEDEVRRIVRRITDARLRAPAGPAQAERLANAYQRYLELKRRFEYPGTPE
jgi:CRP-like cAMP-binding protein